uniref:Uncharacterized protein n=1 Tax=Arundo donax TaxID=35708 RepID=A0A0A9DXW8_ARUDO
MNNWAAAGATRQMLRNNATKSFRCSAIRSSSSFPILLSASRCPLYTGSYDICTRTTSKIRPKCSSCFSDGAFIMLT